MNKRFGYYNNQIGLVYNIPVVCVLILANISVKVMKKPENRL